MTTGSINGKECSMMYVIPSTSVTHNHWLFGARVWAEYNIAGRFLWDFIGMDAQRQGYIFRRRTDKATRILTPAQIFSELTNFKPFLINMERVGDSSAPVVSEPKKGKN